jgi:mannose-6-phosphate isomerase-like protein (cupin superfamily)
MIKRNGTYEISRREKMRDGTGTVLIEHFWKPEELKSSTRLFARLILEPGTSIGFHNHDDEEEIFVVLKGRGRISEGDGTADVMPGDTIRTGDGAGHGVESIGDEPLELLAVILQY